MEIGSVFSWAGVVARLLPVAWRLLRRFLRESHKLTITGTYKELGMMVIAIVVGVVAGFVGGRLFGFSAGLFIGCVVSLVVYVVAVKRSIKEEPVYHAPGFLTVEGREGYFCPKCWDESKRLIPMRVSDVWVPDVGRRVMIACAMCGYKKIRKPEELI